MRPSRTRTAGGRYAAVLVTFLGVALLAACASPAPPESVGPAVEPASWDLSSPDSAVRSYLDWVSYAYRMANSEVPTATMTSAEEVRVDAYIELNRQRGVGIEQSLLSFDATGVSTTAEAAVIRAEEEWRYRYFSLQTLAYTSAPLTASYDTTYTLVSTPQGWLVDRVDVTPRGEVQ